MAGRPPKPTALKILQGNPGKRPLPKREPVSPLGAECPASCQGRARELWKEWAPVFEQMGCLRKADALSFAAWMQIEATVELVRRNGDTPPMTMIKQALNYAVQFGGTPSARARVVVRLEKEKDEFGELYG